MVRARIMGNIIMFTLILVGCYEKQYDFHGKWQSLNEKGFVIEIKKNGNYTLYRDGKSQLAGLTDFEQLKINIERRGQGWYSFRIEDENSGEEFTKGRIEAVNKDRIRIYFHKHHYILDLADEFHRTENLTSFDDIMYKIRQEAETEIQ